MADSNERPIIIWLEDVIDEIQDEVDSLRQRGYEVLTAQGFRHLDSHSREVLRGLGGHRVTAFVLDIMIEGVNDLRPYYQEILSGDTAHGYAAGLVFLEQVLFTSNVYREFNRATVVLNSKRALSDEEKTRVAVLSSNYNRKIIIVEKTSARAVSDYVEASVQIHGETK